MCRVQPNRWVLFHFSAREAYIIGRGKYATRGGTNPFTLKSTRGLHTVLSDSPCFADVMPGARQRLLFYQSFSLVAHPNKNGILPFKQLSGYNRLPSSSLLPMFHTVLVIIFG